MKRLQVFIGALFFLLNIQAQERIKWNQNIDSLSLSYPIIFVDGIEISDDDVAKLDPTDMISVNVIKEGPIYDLVAPRKGKIMIIRTEIYIIVEPLVYWLSDTPLFFCDDEKNDCNWQ